VPIYPTLPANQVEYILRDAGAAAVVCSTAAQVEKIRAVKSGLPSLRHVIVFDTGGRRVVTLASWRRGPGGRRQVSPVQGGGAQRAAADLGDPAVHLGDDGAAQGVMLTHDNICSNVRACVDTLRVSEDDTCLALLPLSHILERMVEYYFLHVGVTIVYAESIDAFAQNLQEIGPPSSPPCRACTRRSTPACSKRAYGRRGEARIFSMAKRAGERGRRTASPASGCRSA